jgi:hypothetical protein
MTALDHKSDKALSLLFTIGSGSTSSYFDKNYKMQTLLLDTASSNKYNWELKKYIISLGLNWKIDTKTDAYFNVPFSYYDYSEMYEEDSYGLRYERAEISENKFDNYKLGIRRNIYNLEFDSRSLNLSLFGEVSIPSKFKNRSANDTTLLLNEDGVFGFRIGGESELNLGKGIIGLNAYYNKRWGNFKDYINIHLEGDLATVTEARLKLFFDGVKSLAKFEDNVQINQKFTPYQENYLATGLGFEIRINEALSFDFNYRITVIGKNSPSLALISLATKLNML